MPKMKARQAVKQITLMQRLSYFSVFDRPFKHVVKTHANDCVTFDFFGM